MSFFTLTNKLFLFWNVTRFDHNIINAENSQNTSNIQINGYPILTYSMANNYELNTFDLIHDLVEWKYDYPTVMVLGASCSGSGTTRYLFKKLNHFIVSSSPEPKFFRDCALRHTIYPKTQEFVFNKSWNLIPFNLKNDYIHCSTDNWKEYLNEFNLSIKSKETKEYPNWGNNSSLKYYFAKTPTLFLSPYTAKTLSHFAPNSKYIILLREKVSNYYSRTKKLICRKEKYRLLYRLSDSSCDCICDVMDTFYTKYIKSAAFTDYLIPLLNAKQTKQTREDLVAWLLSYSLSSKGKGGRNRMQKLSMDLCPYVNVLLFKQNLEHFTMLNGATKLNLKIVQSEYLFNNLKKMIAYFYCFSVYDYESTNNGCVEYLLSNKDAYKSIMSQKFYSKLTEESNEVHRLKKYEYYLDDLNVFDGLSNFTNLCDQRLFEYLKENLSLILGEFNFQIWFDKRSWWRQQIRNLISTK